MNGQIASDFWSGHKRSTLGCGAIFVHVLIPTFSNSKWSVINSGAKPCDFPPSEQRRSQIFRCFKCGRQIRREEGRNSVHLLNPVPYSLSTCPVCFFFISTLYSFVLLFTINDEHTAIWEMVVTCDCVSRNFRTGRLKQELQMVQLSANRCSCIAILWASLVSFVAITLCVASRRVFIVISV
jgi:hypothetical protein